MKSIRKIFFLCLFAFAAGAGIVGCAGHSDEDGHKSLEGSADPANNGGKLSGDHFNNDQQDSLKHRDEVK
jgi:hypothetical protein